MFIFGKDIAGVDSCRREMREGKRDYIGGRLKRVFDAIRNGTFGDLSCMGSILYNLENGNDHYIVCFDFYHYLEAQDKAD